MTTPSRARRRILGLTLAGACAFAGLTLAAGPAGADVPPWQDPSSTGYSANHDPNEVGTLAFYDASGTQIYSGSTTSQPFAKYIVGSHGTRDGDTKAALYAYLPNAATPAGAWTGSLLSAASTYPNASAPGALATASPLLTGAANETTVDEFATEHPNTSTQAGYSSIYELRLRTSGEGRSASDSYDAADISVNGTTWQIVYPQHFTDTTTTLTTTTTTVTAGGNITLTATVASSTTGTPDGTVEFFDGTTSLGSVPLTAGSASTTVKVAHAGSRSYRAVYTPGTGSTFGSSSDTLPVTAAKATSFTSVQWPTGKLYYGRAFTVRATVTATGLVPTGAVAVHFGTKSIGSATLTAGKATITVKGTALTPGNRALTVIYGGSTDVVAGTSAAKTLAIGKAPSTTTDAVSPAKVSHLKQAKFGVKVTAVGVVPSGPVAVYAGATKIASGSLSKGSATFTLPKLAKGKHTLHAVYGGSTLVAASTGKSVVLTST